MTEVFEFEKPDGSVLEIDAPNRAAAVKAYQRMSANPKAAPSGFMQFLNRGIVSTLGAPMDASNAIANTVGMGVDRAAFGSSRMESGMRDVLGADTVPRADETAETPLARVGEAVGQGIAAALPIGAAGRLAQGGTSLASGAIRTVADPFVKAPVRAFAIDAAASTGAGLGGLAADNQIGGPAARGVAEIGGALVGGLSASGVISAAKQAPKLVVPFGRAIRASVVPFTESGARVRAGDRMRSMTADPQGAAAAIDEPYIAALSPAQRTGDARLMALERAVLDSDAGLDAQFKVATADAASTLKRALEAPGGGKTFAATREAIEARRGHFLGLMDTRIAQARATAAQKVEALSPARRETENSMIVRQEIDAAYADARAQEAELWANIPKDAGVDTVNMRGEMAQILRDTPRAQQGDIPAIARNLLGKGGFGARETVNEVHGLYSELRRVARAARSGLSPNRNLARQADLLAEAALKDLGARSRGDRVGALVNEARDFSRVMNETFTQGDVGKLLGSRTEGGAAVPPELTLGTTIGRGGPRAAVSADQIAKAGGAGIDGQAAQADFLRRRASEFAAPRGVFSPERAADFIRQNDELLNRFPYVRKNLVDAIDAAKVGASDEARIGRRSAGLRDPKVSAGALVERAPIGGEIDAVFKAKDPVSAAKSLRLQASKDRTGGALAGYKGAALDHLMREAKSGITDSGDTALSGRRIINLLGDTKTRAVLNEILSPDELRRVQRIAQELRKLEMARGALPNVDGVINDAPSQIISTIARVFAARQGAKLGHGATGASLQTASMFSSRAKKILGRLTNDRAERLIRDAMTDPELFKALLMDSAKPAQAKQAERALMAWFGGLAVDGEDEQAQ
jgi:hypothetical protein